MEEVRNTLAQLIGAVNAQIAQIKSLEKRLTKLKQVSSQSDRIEELESKLIPLELDISEEVKDKYPTTAGNPSAS